MNGCIRSTVHDGWMPSAISERCQGTTQTVATLRREDEVDGVFACARKERHVSRAGTPYLTLELATAAARSSHARSETPTCSPGASSEATSCMCADVSSAFAMSCRSTSARSGARGRGGRPDALSAHRLSRPGRARRLPRAPRKGGVRRSALKALLGRLLGDARAARRDPPGALLDPRRRAPAADAGVGPSCLSGRPARAHGGRWHDGARAVCRSTRASIATCCSAPRSSTTSARRASSPTARRSDAAREGRLLGHVQLGLRVLAEHLPATLEGERRLALEHCVMLHHGSEAAAGQRFGSAEALALYRLNALDSQREGRARARAGPLEPEGFKSSDQAISSSGSAECR